MLQYETKRLLLKTEFETSWCKILDFYEKNKQYFEPYEPTRCKDFYTPSYQLTVLSVESQLTKSHSYLRLWLYLKEDPKTIIGTICFSDIFRQSSLLGYKMDEAYTKHGYCYEACEKGLSIMKTDYHLNKVVASVLPHNLPSIHLLERLHFTNRGEQKDLIEINHTMEKVLLYEKYLT